MMFPQDVKNLTHIHADHRASIPLGIQTVLSQGMERET